MQVEIRKDMSLLRSRPMPPFKMRNKIITPCTLVTHRFQESPQGTLIEFCILKKLARQIKISMNAVSSRFRIAKYSSDIFPVKMVKTRSSGFTPIDF